MLPLAALGALGAASGGSGLGATSQLGSEFSPTMSPQAGMSFTSVGQEVGAADPSTAPTFTNDYASQLGTGEAPAAKKPGMFSKFGMGGGGGPAPKYFDPSGSGGAFAPQIDGFRVPLNRYGV